jgi:hypothetical protein
MNKGQRLSAMSTIDHEVGIQRQDSIVIMDSDMRTMQASASDIGAFFIR